MIEILEVIPHPIHQMSLQITVRTSSGLQVTFRIPVRVLTDHLDGETFDLKNFCVPILNCPYFPGVSSPIDVCKECKQIFREFFSLPKQTLLGLLL